MKATIENVRNGYLLTIDIHPRGSVPLRASFIFKTGDELFSSKIKKLIERSIKKEGVHWDHIDHDPVPMKAAAQALLSMIVPKIDLKKVRALQKKS